MVPPFWDPGPGWTPPALPETPGLGWGGSEPLFLNSFFKGFRKSFFSDFWANLAPEMVPNRFDFGANTVVFLFMLEAIKSMTVSRFDTILASPAGPIFEENVIKSKC